VPTRIIAQNNAIIARSDDNPYITQRSIDSVPTPGKSDKLFEYQSSLLYRNRKTADLRAYKAAGVVRSTNRLLSQDASTLSDINAISALNAIARLGDGKTKASIDKLRPILEAQPSDVGLILVLTQLYILSNNPGAATTILETLFTNLEKSDSHSDKLVRFSPGLVSIIVSLYKLQGRTTSLRAELSRAAAFWQQQSVPSTSLCRAAGLALVNSYQSDDLETASEIFMRMRQQDPSDAIAKAGYIAATVTTNYSAVETDLQSLTPIKSLTNDIDAEALEDAGIALLPVTNQVVTKKRTSPTDIEKPKKTTFPQVYMSDTDTIWDNMQTSDQG
jgi:signal recognition particle subunit SRP72